MRFLATKNVSLPSKSTYHTKRLSMIKNRSIIASLLITLMSINLMGCDRPTLRKIINFLGSEKKEAPEVYHEYEGYSPGLKRSHVEEDFNRYHYYIATEFEEMLNPEPDIYFRQDYETYEVPDVQFDEEAYWREHPIQIDGQPDTPIHDEQE